MLWNEIKSAIDGALIQDPSSFKNAEISHLLTDSRLLKSAENTLFFAISGKQDGHDFIHDLYQKGVRFFVIERAIDLNKFPDAAILLVPNAIAGLQSLAKHKRSQAKLEVIGITGSNGKTTIKEWLYSMLVTEKKAIKTPKSYNSQIGVPLSIWNIQDTHEIGVFEAGISQTGEMEKLEPIIQPTLGIFTTIGPAHDQGFSNKKEKIAEKAQLFSGTKKIICCREHTEVYQELINRYKERVIDWSTEESDAKCYVKQNGPILKLRHQDLEITFNIPFDFSIWSENCIHAIIAALEVGISSQNIQAALNNLQPVKMRLAIKKGINGCYLIDDTYNNDLQGLEVALDFLKRQKQRSKKTLILSELVDADMADAVLADHLTSLIRSNDVSRLILIGNWHHTVFESLDSKTQHFVSKSAFLQDLPSFRDEMILIKGARSFKFEEIVNQLQEKTHQTRLEVNFEALVHNLNEYRRIIPPNVKTLAMVKAFGYGGGSSEIANLLQFHNIDYLGVAFSNEAFQLRENGIHVPILVLNPDFDQLNKMSALDIEPEVYSLSMLNRLVQEENTPPIHLKIETGMNRLGFPEGEWQAVAQILSSNPQLRVAGIFTHLSSADEIASKDFSEKQLYLFNNAYELISNALGYQPIRHVLNSAGIIRYPNAHYDMVRLGIGLYGYDPTKTLNLRQTGKLITHVSQIKHVKKGDYVGYNRKGEVRKDGYIAILPIGYADGFDRRFGNGVGQVIWNGIKLSTIGNICMDMTMIDIKTLDVKEGDEIEIFGEDQTIAELASQIDSIPYEILTSISQRVVRIYQSE